MSHFKHFMRVVGVVGVIALIYLGLILSSSFLYMLSPFGGYDLLFVEFIGGFWFFLRDNLSAISFDTGTWGPGVAAFLLAVIFAHRILKAWAAGAGRHWTFSTTFCLALILPVLFVISFIVPGVLLQWEMLRQVVWIEVR